MRTLTFAPISLLAALCCSLQAQSVVVPNTSATTSTGLLLNNPLREVNMARTYQQGIAASELAGIPIGSVITGISARNGHTTSNVTYPPAGNAVWNNYDVFIGPAIPLASWTGTFASNFNGVPSPARAGAMTIETGSFVFTPNIGVPQVHPWSTFYWDLQRPFVYTGGELAILYTHPGSTSTSSIWLDAVAPGTTTRAYATASYQGTSGSSTNFVVVRIHYGYGRSCPGAQNQLPVLVQTNDVTGGGPVTWAVGNGAANAPVVFAFGLTRTSIPLFNGCTLLTAPLVTVGATTSSLGRSSFTLTVPAGIRGVVHVQSFLLDAGAPGGLSGTNGTSVTISP
jgi:hypothetical protein